MSVIDLQKRAARAGWQLTCTSTGSYMLRKGHTSRHYGELIDVQRDVARLAAPRRKNGL